MRKSRSTDEQIMAALQEAEAGASTQELCRRHRISRETFYRWRRKYGGLECDEARRLKAGRGRESAPDADRGRPGASGA